MKSLICKLSLAVVFLSSLTASAQSQQAFDGNALGSATAGLPNSFQNVNLPAFCGNGEEDEGEECDRGARNGNTCESCTQDCKLRWVPADCSPFVKIDLEQLRHSQLERLAAELLNQEDDVNHTTQAPPPAGTAVTPPADTPLTTDAPAPTQGSQPDTVEVPTVMNEAAGGCSFVELVNGPGSLGQVLVMAVSLIPLAAIRRRKN